MSEQGPRLAWFTPLRPVESGISLYSEEILPVLAGAWQLDVYVDGYRPSHLRPSDHLQIRDARDFRRAQRAAPYDAIVYQMGNSPAHAYMYWLALEFPGVLVLHDTVLHHLMLSMLLRGRRVRDYRARMAARYGDEGRAVAERVLRGQMASSLFDYPLSEEVVEASRTVVVHSEFSRAQVRARCPSAMVMRVPMGVRLPPEIPAARARALLGLPDDQVLLASVTHVNPYKRVDLVLRALRRLRQFQPARMLVAGTVSPMVPLDRLVSLLGLEQAVECFGYVDDRTARLLVAAADICVNLRYPTAGETSASLLRLMGAGRPVLVTDAGSFSEMPDDAVVKVRPDALEEETIFALLEQLAARPALRAAVGRNARAFIAREHGLPAMVAGYRAVLESALGQAVPEPPVTLEIESLDLHGTLAEPADPLAEEVAQALVELGLGGDDELARSAARAMVDLGTRVSGQ